MPTPGRVSVSIAMRINRREKNFFLAERCMAKIYVLAKILCPFLTMGAFLPANF